MNKTATHPTKKQSSGALHLTKKVDYGITLLAVLAQAKKEEDKKSIKTIAEEKKMSFSFLQKVARGLQQANYIEAERGKYGGYVLKKNPEKLTLKQIIETLEGPIAIVPCLKNNTCARKEKCNIHTGLKLLNDDILKYLEKRTLKQLIS